MVKNMKIINLVKSEFIKNYNVKRWLIITIVLIIASLFLIRYTDNLLKEKATYDDTGLEISIESFENALNNLEKKEDKMLDDEYEMFFSRNYIDYMNILLNKEINHRNDWKFAFIDEQVLPTLSENFLIEKIVNEQRYEEVLEFCDYKDENSSVYGIKICQNILSADIDNGRNLTKLEELYKNNLQTITDYQQLLEEDKYYLYLQYQVDHGKIEKDEFVQILLDKKVETNTDFLGLNYLQYQRLEENAEIEIMDEEEYNQTPSGDYASYQEYVTYNTKLKNDAIKNREILLYSTEHEIEHDISYNLLDGVTEGIRYMNTKIKVNQVFHLSVVVMIIVAITNSGIISREHSKGTIKNIITTPVQRWKILLSKFIYLLLDTYLIWLLGLVIISLLAGIQYGFNDLLDPKLVYVGGQVKEVNYYLYILKDIFLASIPIICFLSVLFFLSAVTLNTSLTVGIISSLSVVSFFLWIMMITNSFPNIVYTPFWYLDCGYILSNAEIYVDSLRNVSYNLGTGIISSLIISIILYILTNIVYIKRDIKN